MTLAAAMCLTGVDLTPTDNATVVRQHFEPCPVTAKFEQPMVITGSLIALVVVGVFVATILAALRTRIKLDRSKAPDRYGRKD